MWEYPFIIKEGILKESKRDFIYKAEVMIIGRRINIFEKEEKRRKNRYISKRRYKRFIYNIKIKKKKSVVGHDDGNTDNTKEEEKKKEDEKDGFIKREFSNDAPEWREYGDGCNIEGYCSNKECVCFNDLVDFCVGYDTFDAFDLKRYHYHCCICHVKCVNVIHYNYRDKERDINKEREKGISLWKERREGYDVNDIIDEGSIEYKTLLIKTGLLLYSCY